MKLTVDVDAALRLVTLQPGPDGELMEVSAIVEVTGPGGVRQVTVDLPNAHLRESIAAVFDQVRAELPALLLGPLEQNATPAP